MTGYWFARYRLKPEGRGIVPVAWQGIAVIVGFVGGIVLGGLGYVLLSLAHYYFLAIMWFAVCAFGVGATFIWAAVTKSDPDRTVADYRANGASN